MNALRARLPLLLVVAAVLLALGVAQSSFGSRALRTIGFSGPPQRYTELAFTEANALPARLPASGSFTLDVTLRNREGADRRYDWAVISQLAGSSASARLADGSLDLPGGQAKSITTTVVVTCPATATPTTRIRVDFALRTPPRRLTHWIFCPILPVPVPKTTPP